MTNLITNRFDMIGTCINTALSTLYKPAWFGQSPEDFGTDLDALIASYGSTAALAAQLAGAGTGEADEKEAAETALEGLAYQMARALANHFKKTGDLASRAKVNVRLSAIQKLRDAELVAFTTTIRALATTASADPNASKRGITPARVTALSGSIALFDGLKNQPRTGIVSHSALLRELETDVAGLMEDIADLDDLVIQFDETELGQQFIAAWKQARMIVDAGHGPAATPAEPTTPAPASINP